MRDLVQPNDQYDALFRKAAAACGLDWLLLKAQAMAESNLDPKAVSPAGAQGIAQFMPATWQEWGEKAGGFIGDPFDPADAIPAQARYLAWLLAKLDGDVPSALAAYNWGIGNVRRLVTARGHLDETALPRETRDYIARIRRFQTALTADHFPNNANPQPNGEKKMELLNETQSKRLVESKTFWVNALAGVLTLGLNLIGAPIPGDVVVVTVASAIVNIGLRFLTKKPVTL